ncbi:MAG: hypothetical protein WCI95_07550 [bacterium]
MNGLQKRHFYYQTSIRRQVNANCRVFDDGEMARDGLMAVVKEGKQISRMIPAGDSSPAIIWYCVG